MADQKRFYNVPGSYQNQQPPQQTMNPNMVGGGGPPMPPTSSFGSPPPLYGGPASIPGNGFSSPNQGKNFNYILLFCYFNFLSISNITFNNFILFSYNIFQLFCSII